MQDYFKRSVNSFGNTKIQVQSVSVNNEVYSVNTMVKHAETEEIGIIIKISKLINDTHEIFIKYNNGKIKRYGIEVLVENKLISKV